MAVLTSLLTWLGCASLGPDLPYCPPLEELPPPPDAQCRSDPSAQSLESRLRERIEGAAGPLLVRVAIDEGSHVGPVCADRSRASGERRARTSFARELDAIRALPPGPSCLAGSRLDFNRGPAELAATEAALLDCEWEAESAYRSSANNPSRPKAAGLYRARLAYVSCLGRQQKRLGQLWFIDPHGIAPLRVGYELTSHFAIFHETQYSKSRRETIEACSTYRQSTEMEVFGSKLGLSRDGRELTACVTARGWSR